MVKDHRYDITTSDVQGVLKGDLKDFLEDVVITKMFKDYHIEYLCFLKNQLLI